MIRWVFAVHLDMRDGSGVDEPQEVMRWDENSQNTGMGTMHKTGRPDDPKAAVGYNCVAVSPQSLDF